MDAAGTNARGGRGKRRLRQLARGLGLVLAATGALALFAREVGEHYPVRNWIFWVYLKIWGYVALFAAASCCGGHLALSLLRVRSLPLRERVVYTVAAGVLTFYYLVFVGGLLHLLRPWFAIAMPVVLIAAGGIPLFRSARRAARHLSAARRRGAPRSSWTTPITLFGALGVGLVYYSILSPRNIAFDASFYHLGIAQQYATEHAILPFREGWLPGALPHLASVLYTWAFVLPGLDMFGRIECAAHLEFALFLFTLAAIPVLVRYLAPRASAAASWAAVFLFPGILVYDSSLTVAADHVAAFWAVPAWLAFRRLYRDFEPRNAVLLAACLAGAILTKYQSMYILAFPILASAARATFLIARSGYDKARRRTEVPRSAFLRPLQALGAAAVAGLTFTSPHWLKNWVFYGDPLFPYLNGIFHPVRWVPDTGRIFAEWSTRQTQKWVPTGTLSEKLTESAKAMLNFSFTPHDWPSFHGKVPVFGSLFTLSLLLLPFLAKTRRTWALSAATHLGVFIWFWTMHQDRYLQVLLPWMAAVVASTVSLAFRSGLTGKVAVSALVLFQIVWGLDAYLIPAHAMTRASPLSTTTELLSKGYKKQYEERFRMSGTLFEIGASKELPANARVLLHEQNPRLGLWRPIVVDVAGSQFGLRYELHDSAAALDDALRDLGVTHILSRGKAKVGMDCLGADLRFFAYVERNATLVRRWGEMRLSALPSTRPEATGPSTVLYLGCGKYYDRGLHRLSTLSVRDAQVQKKPPRRRADKPATAELEPLLAVAEFAVTDAKCKPPADVSKLGGFVRIGRRGTEELWVKSDGGRGAAAPPIDEPTSEEEDDALLFGPQ